MTHYVEAMLLLLPPDAGGRATAVLPREGSYLPFLRVDGHLRRARLIEGPPRVAPGEQARVVFEIGGADAATLTFGTELQLFELDDRVVGIVTILRVCPDALSA